MLTKTFWKPISANAIFVTDDNVTKRRDYEDEVVKVFYLKNVTSVQEFQEIVTAVRSVTDIRRMFTYNAQNAVMARGTVDQINLAEKLFHDLDKPKSEVVIDVIVLEVNSDRAEDYRGRAGFRRHNGLGDPRQLSRRRSTLTIDRNSHRAPPRALEPGPEPGHWHHQLPRQRLPATGTTATISASHIGQVSFERFFLDFAGCAAAGHADR